MMREILDDRNSGYLRPHFETPLHAPEAGQSRDDRLPAYALSRGQRRGGRRIQRVVLAGQAHGEPGPQGALAPHRPVRAAVLILQIPYPPFGIFAEPVSL